MLDLNELSLEQTRLNTKGSNTDWKKKYVQMPPGEGSVFVRLLPPALDKSWYVATRYHRIGNYNFYSHQEFVKGKWEGSCPLNMEYKRLWSEIDALERNKRMDAATELRDTARKIGPIEKYHYACIVRSEMLDGKEVRNSGPKVLSVGKELHKKIINAVMGVATLRIKGLGDVTDFKLGRDFQIVKGIRAGKDAFPEYGQSSFLEISQACDTKDEWERWMANLPDLAAERRLKPIADMQNALDIFFGRKADPATQFQSAASNLKPIEIRRPATKEVITMDDDDKLSADDDFISDLRKVN